MEPVVLLGKEKFAEVNIRIRVKEIGYISQIYAICHTILKALIAYNYEK